MIKQSDSTLNDDFKLTPLESALFQITECAVKTNSMEEYSRLLHTIVKQLMFAENFFVALYEQNSSVVNFIYVVDEFEESTNMAKIRLMSKDKLRRTLTGYMLRTGQSQHLSNKDILNLIDRNVIDFVGESSWDWLGVPLIYNNQVLGGIVVQSYSNLVTYGPKEKNILQFVARQIALVFKSKQSELALLDANAILEKKVGERTHDLKSSNQSLAIEIQERKRSQEIQLALFQITELVSTSESIKDFYASVHQIIKRLMYAENEYIAIVSESDGDIEFPYFVDQWNESPVRRKFVKNKKIAGFTEKVILSGKTYLYHDEDVYDGVLDHKKCYSWLGVPLKEKQVVFGVLAIQSYERTHAYSQEDQAVLLTIGQQVATAIQRKKDTDSLKAAHEHLERRVKERTFELEETIERRKIVEQKLEHESLHDALTGLPNRLYLLNSLNALLAVDSEAKKIPLALLFLDLDRFKIINDSLGHHIGDLFLIEVGNRLKECLRAGDLVARLGGDEFCVLMPELAKDTHALQLSVRILNELKRPVEVGNHSLITSASIGVRLGHSKEESAAIIMSDADAAMYQAKHQGKNRYCIFDSKIKLLVTNRMRMERDLREAIDKKQLYLEYQPIVDIINRRVEGFEGLVRWQHPKKGMISPADFIPIAEETGLIVDVGEAVIDMACKSLGEFSQSIILKGMYINVNVSSVQILARTLGQFIRTKLNQYQVAPEKLNIEITESILIDDYKAALSFVQELKSMKVQIYLDDFGTGYSSLSYLHKFPFDVIKLDRSFIQALDESGNNQAIVESIGLLARNLGIRIVAEGIETQSQLDTILRMNYRVVQGYFFSRPLHESKLEAFVKSFH